MGRSIYVTGQFIAYHRWVGATENVAFLASWHRHVFKVRIDLSVTHDNRDLEFFTVQRVLAAVLQQWSERQVDMSCEMFCDAIASHLSPSFTSLSRVEVSEDGENGAILHITDNTAGV